jgi:hemolysin activation/secretion protein
LMLQGIRQNSDVSTLGGSAVAGNGEIYGARLLFDLPGRPGLFHTAGFGFDYKHFGQDIFLDGEFVGSPVTYWPFVASYTGFWMGRDYQLELDAAMTFSFQGLGSDEIEFDNRRFGARGSFLTFRGAFGVTRDLPLGFQIFGQLQGQAAGMPLVDSEQFALGGLTTVRGYLESEVLGDSAVCGTLELRSPSLLAWIGPEANEWRFFGFVDAGAAWLNDPLPGQQEEFSLWSYGFGSTMRLLDHLNASFAVGFPQVTQNPTLAGNPLVSFRFWGEL